MLTLEDLKRLAAVSGPCLTIFQPLRDDYSQVTRPKTRIVAALQEAGRLLVEKGFGAGERDEMLRPLMAVASNTEWAGRKGSLAMFRAPGLIETEFWPDVLAPRVYFGGELLVLPLLPELLRNRDFWLLALSIKAVRLFRGSRNGMDEIPLPRGVPKSLTDAGGFEPLDHTLRGQSNAGRSAGKMKAVPFGTSTMREVKPEYLHDFFRAIDRGIQSILAADPQPLILAGVTRELAIYRKVNSYSKALAGSVHGSPDASGVDSLHTKASELYARASELMSSFSAGAMSAVLGGMDEAAGRGLLVMDPWEVLEQARAGHVADLILSPGAAGFEQHEEVINGATLATARHAGKISLVNAPQLLAGVAGILRYRQNVVEGGAVETDLVSVGPNGG